ncbi:MAG: hypothetical protein HC896_07985 [Bacteroidales bacterium]|nr:hypothetical protein [Bacteroidales bacterium]
MRASKANNDLKWVRTFDYEDGLPYGKINCLVTDSANYVYIGTVNGVYYYNGIKIKPLASLCAIDSIAEVLGSEVFDMVAHGASMVYIGLSSGLVAFNKEDNSFRLIKNSPKGNSIQNNYIRSLYIANNTLYAGNWYGYSTINLADGSIKNFQLPAQANNKFAQCVTSLYHYAPKKLAYCGHMERRPLCFRQLGQHCKAFAKHAWPSRRFGGSRVNCQAFLQ